MFDMREDGESDPRKLSQMMQNLGVFISVKPKVKQTAKVCPLPIMPCYARSAYPAVLLWHNRVVMFVSV